MTLECAAMATGWIMTRSGRRFWPLAPRIEDVDINDIAHALSMCCRFQGMTSRFYSVAEHSVSVSSACFEQGGIVAARYGLLHDAAEAYLGDVPRPLKKQDAFAPYRAAERALERLIYERFWLNPDAEPDLVRHIDRRMLRAEQRDLMPPAWPGEIRDDCDAWPSPCVGYAPVAAYRMFLDAFSRLFGKGIGR